MTEQTTLEQVSQTVSSYYKMQQEISRLEMTRQLLKESLLQYWKEMGCPDKYDSGDNLRLRILPKLRESIPVEEARALLDQPTFDKLLKVTSFDTVSVRKLKGRMMARKSKEQSASERQRLQDGIRERYGDRIDEAKQRPCQRCRLRFCALLPITSNGSDCPYRLERKL